MIDEAEKDRLARIGDDSWIDRAWENVLRVTSSRGFWWSIFVVALVTTALKLG